MTFDITSFLLGVAALPLFIVFLFLVGVGFLYGLFLYENYFSREVVKLKQELAEERKLLMDITDDGNSRSCISLSHRLPLPRRNSVCLPSFQDYSTSNSQE